ncbi:MAG: bifunctional nuclease domain-containing protein [Candidatus Binatia bacterium]
MIPCWTTQRACISTLLVMTAVSLHACRTKEQSEVEVAVRSVGYDNASHAPVVVLEDAAGKVALPIWIGPAEAQAIVMQMQGISPPRPMTHDLLKTILDQAGVDFQKVVINDLRESTYYAQIWLHAGRKELQIDSRPSDAIALAIRFHRPIFVARALMKGDNTIALQQLEPLGRTARISGVTVQALTAGLAEYFGLPPGHGVLVADVDRNAPTALRRGDVIVAVDGVAVTGVGDFANRMDKVASGQPADLSVRRGNKQVRVEFGGHAG